MFINEIITEWLLEPDNPSVRYYTLTDLLDQSPECAEVLAASKACEFILEHSQEPEQGGFACYKSQKTGGGLPSYVVPCLTGNMVWSLIRLAETWFSIDVSVGYSGNTRHPYTA